MTVFSRKKLDYTKQPMFFGEHLSIVRNDVQKYPIFSKLTKTQKSFFWNPEEINLEKDKIDYKNLSAHEQHIFTKNIAYQTMLDSIQERSPLLAFLPWISIPELEGCVIWWAAFEQIHSESYQWILRNIYPDPSVVFDLSLDDLNIINRADAIIRYYDDFIDYSTKYRAFGPGRTLVQQLIEYAKDEVLPAVGPLASPGIGLTEGIDSHPGVVTLSLYELKTKLYLALFSVFCLESVRFYVSFACSFAFGQQGKMKGNADIIKLIAKDEAQHVGIVVNILRNLTRKENDPDFVQIAAEQEETVLKMFDEVVDQEKEWAKYLFKDGSIVGLNEPLLCKFLEFTANKRLRSLGFKQRYENTTDPFGWMSSWLGSEDQQVAPQEKEVTDYLINVLDTNVNEANLLEI